ncbi:MAG: ATP synthase F1 subunit gamma [Lachnospiraceae bacterium]|nr:ATP synthase F1 subunit gamma [Lachnospiraceae bacterium]
MASMADLKKRRESIQSTGQITRAMKLVATVKLQKARQKAEKGKPYNKLLYDTMSSIMAYSRGISHPYINGNGAKKKAVIVITSNRGLAGGYNANIVRMVTSSPKLPKEDTVIYALGKKGRELLVRRGYAQATDLSDIINAPMFSDAFVLTEMLIREYDAGNIGEVYIAYSAFINTVTQQPRLVRLLPIDTENVDIDREAQAPMNFESDEEEALSALIPKYMTNYIYGAFNEAVASENGARMQAMDSATSNAEEIMEDLELEYNRARQSSITQELTEIIAGANAIG